MIGAKPIKARCMAMILSAPDWPEWIGKIVTVVSKGSPDQPDRSFWLINVPDEVCNCYCLEADLLRLDDPEIQEQIEDELELVCQQ